MKLHSTETDCKKLSICETSHPHTQRHTHTLHALIFLVAWQKMSANHFVQEGSHTILSVSITAPSSQELP